ncbi:hypothetical protein Tco_1338652 [Tanacetum coccineum]
MLPIRIFTKPLMNKEASGIVGVVDFYHKITLTTLMNRGKPIQKLRQKGVYEESFSRHAAWIGGKLIQLMHTTMVQEQVKTMKIQVRIMQISQGNDQNRANTDTRMDRV